MDNRNEIDSAPHAIQRMVEVSIRAAESLLGDGDDTDFFQMPSADANLLDSSLFDIEKRVEEVPACGVPKVIPHRAFSSGIPAWPCRLLRPQQAF
jgi:hypothetical protein